MARPSKKDIKAAIDKLKAPAEGSSASDSPNQSANAHLEPKKTSQRIRKKGV